MTMELKSERIETYFDYYETVGCHLGCTPPGSKIRLAISEIRILHKLFITKNMLVSNNGFEKNFSIMFQENIHLCINKKYELWKYWARAFYLPHHRPSHPTPVIHYLHSQGHKLHSLEFKILIENPTRTRKLVKSQSCS